MRAVARTSRAATGARPDAHEEPLRRGPGLPDAALRHVAAHLRVHPLGGAAQRQLAQGDQVPLAEEPVDRARGGIGHVDLALAQSLLEHVRRDVHQLDVVGPLQDHVGDRLPHLDAGDAGDDVVEALEVLDVERGVDVDPAGEQLLDVLPPLGVAGAGHVGVRQLVHQQEGGVPRDGGVEVELLEHGVPRYSTGRLGIRSRSLQQGRGLRAPVRLHHADHHVESLGAAWRAPPPAW